LYEKYNFRRYVSMNVKQVHPEMGITFEAANEVNYMLHYVLEKLMCAANQLIIHSHRGTVTRGVVLSAAKLVLPGELGAHAISDAHKALATWFTSGPGKKGKGTTKNQSSRAAIKFPVKRVANVMRIYADNCSRLSAKAAVFTAGLLDYLCLEILELAGNAAREYKKQRINTRFIKIAIVNDEELKDLFSSVTLSGGIMPNIHHKLLPKNAKKKDKVETEERTT